MKYHWGQKLNSTQNQIRYANNVKVDSYTAEKHNWFYSYQVKITDIGHKSTATNKV